MNKSAKLGLLVNIIYMICSYGALAQQIPSFPNATTPFTGAEQTYLVQGGASKNMTLNQLATWAGPTVANNTALENACASSAGCPAGSPIYANGVERLGFAAAGDGPAVIYNTSTSACTVNSGNGDGGFQVKLKDGGCATANLLTFQGGVPLTLWGNITGTDDSALFAAADAAMGSAAWVGAKTLYLPAGNIAPSNSGGTACTAISNIQQIIGAGDQPGGTALVGLSASCAYVLQYAGAGPIAFQNFAVTCASYAQVGTFAAPACPNVLLGVQPVAATQQVTNVVAKGLRFVGGNGYQFRVAQAFNVDLDIDQNIAPYSFGVVVTDISATGPTTQIANVHVKLRDCRVPGQYCLSMPVNLTGTPIIYSPRDIDVDIHCNGAGYIANKSCADLTGSTADQMRVRAFSMNGFQGTEIKHTNAFDSNASPGEYTNINADIIEHKQIDVGTCALFPYETTAVAPVPNQYRNLVANITCTWSPPPARLSGAQVFAGDVYTYSGNTYLVVADGVLSSGTPTLGTTPVTGYADGTAVVEYTQATPTQSAALQGFSLEAVSDFDITLHGFDIATGAVLTPEGSSDNTIRNGRIKIVGSFNRGCLQDGLNTEFGAVNGFIDNVTFDNWDAHITSANLSSQDCLVLGATNGTQTNTWTNLHINGGNFIGRFALRTMANGGAITGNAIGANFEGYNAAFSIASPNFTMTLSGGRLADTGGVGNTSGLISAASGATGSITLLNVTGHNSNPANQGSVSNAGSIAVSGQIFNDVASATTPTSKCAAGVDFEPGTVPATAYLWGCSAANTWGKAY